MAKQQKPKPKPTAKPKKRPILIGKPIEKDEK
jgi:hypothetical protein